MWTIIGLNIDKKLSIFSTIFMLVSIVIVYLISIYYASFELSEFATLNEYNLVVSNYISDSILLIEIISVFFIILLVELELFYNTENFDSYYVTLVGKDKYFIAKTAGYIFVILFYTAFIFLGLVIIYLIRFKTTQLLEYFISIFHSYLIYNMLIFSLSYLLLILFKNYFSAMLVFLYYWASKLIEQNSDLLNIVFPKISINPISEKVNFNIKTNNVLLLVMLLLIFCKYIYRNKDLKINS